jgi:hypothetical protein
MPSYVATIARFGSRLQILWDSPDDESKQRRFVQLHYWLMKFFLHPSSDWTPEMLMEERHGFRDPLDHLIVFLGDNLSRMRHCPRLGCKNPYFLAARGSTKFCSTECAVEGRKKAPKSLLEG